MYKTLIQLVLFLILIFILSLTFYKYFYSKKIETNQIVNNSTIIQNSDKQLKKEEGNSVIYNLSYKKFDIQNNVYLIEANKGTMSDKNSNIISMDDVKATIIYLNNEKLFIISENAIFNNKSFETKFFNGVELTYQDQKLKSESLDFLFDKNIAIFSDNVRYENLDTKMFSDKITVNLLTKEIEITSKNKSNRIKIEKNK